MKAKYFILSYLFLFVLFSSGWAQAHFSLDTTTYAKGYTNGLVFGDFNNDGYQDFYISNGHNEAPSNVNHLFFNNGDGTFSEQLSAGTLVTDDFVSGSSTVGDYDNDGYLDIFVAEVYREKPPFGSDYATTYSLYKNNGDGTFSSVSAGDLTTSTTETGGGAAWADYDNDGYLDLAISTARITFIGIILADSNALYRNNQDGTFDKVFNTLTSVKSHQGDLSWADYDNDGDMDVVFVAGRPSQKTVLWTNTGTDFDSLTILTDQDAQGASWADYDNDGDLDLFITCNGINNDNQYPEQNFLFRNDGTGFTQILSGELVTDTLFSYTSAWGDYDNDGDLDVYVGNSGGSSAPQTSYLYVNDGQGNFIKDTLTVISGDSTTYDRTAAWADIDNDGDLDLVLGRDGRNHLFRNLLNNGNHFITIQLRGVNANRSGIGAKVRVKATINGQSVTQLREISGQTGFGSQNSLRAHFGLGDATMADSIIVEWPGTSTVDKLAAVPADQFLTITEGQASSIGDERSASPRQFSLQQNYPNPFGKNRSLRGSPTTVIRYRLPQFSKVQLTVYNTLGQKVRTLVNERQTAGKYSITFDATGLASGVYYYRLEEGNKSLIRKMLYLK